MIIFIVIIAIIIIIFLIYITQFKIIDRYENIEYIDSKNIRTFLPIDKFTKTDKKIRVYYNFSDVKKLDDKYYNILVDLEPINLNNDLPFDIILSFKEKNNIFVIPGLLILHESHNHSLYELLYRKKYNKNKFCCFCYSNCNEKYDGVSKRIKFFDMLSKYKFVNSIGKCKNNTEFKEKYEYWIDNIIENYKEYKFVIVGENNIINNYITEKIFTALCAGCIPIYIGSSNINNYIYSDCYINVNDFDSYEDCINYVLKVDSDDELYDKYISSPILSKKMLYNLAPWYFGDLTFFSVFNEKIPWFKIIRYQNLDINFNSTNNPNKVIKILNLSESVDRYTYMKEQLDKKPFLNYEFFLAIEGSEYKQYFIDNSLINFKFKFLDGELGIWLTSCEIYKNLVNDDNNDYYAVFEDDINIENINFPIEYYVQNAPKDWDIIYLYANSVLYKYKELHEIKGYDQEYVKLNSSGCTGGCSYIIRKRMAQYILNFAFPLKNTVDTYINSLFDSFNAYLYIEKGEMPIYVDFTIESTIRDYTDIINTYFKN